MCIGQLTIAWDSMKEKEVANVTDDELIEEEGDTGYTAFQQWPYEQLIYRVEEGQERFWISLTDSFFQAGLYIVQRVAAYQLREDIEGRAGVFLFRHYLELALKQIILRGRFLRDADENANPQEVAPVRRIHNLQTLWEWVLRDACPKMPPETWNQYDVEFVRLCVGEFHAADESGFAFRYSGEGGERHVFSWQRLENAMQHVHQILAGITGWLVMAHDENAEWEAFLEAEYRYELEG